MGSRTVYAMDVNYQQNEYGIYEGWFSMTYDNEQVIGLMNDFNRRSTEVKKYHEIILLTPHTRLRLKDLSFEGYSDHNDLRSGINSVIFKFRCKNIISIQD